MCNKIAVLLALILAVGGSLPAVNAVEESYTYCVNSTHRAWKQTFNYTNGTASTIHTFETLSNCSYGCLNGECLPSPGESHDIAIVMGMMLAAFFFLYGAFKFDSKRHAPLQIFFLFISVYFVSLNLALLGRIADTSSLTLIDSAIDAGYMLTTYVIWILAVYFIIWFLYEMLISFNKIKPIGFGNKKEE